VAGFVGKTKRTSKKLFPLADSPMEKRTYLEEGLSHEREEGRKIKREAYRSIQHEKKKTITKGIQKEIDNKMEVRRGGGKIGA